MSEQTERECGCIAPQDTMDNFKDFLGKYTIILNGTIIQKRADQPQELSFEHKSEIVDKFNKLLIADRRRVLDEVEALFEQPMDRIIFPIKKIEWGMFRQKALQTITRLKG